MDFQFNACNSFREWEFTKKYWNPKVNEFQYKKIDLKLLHSHTYI